jgi:PleD family two-component response regulator
MRDGVGGAIDVDGRQIEVRASLGVATYRPGDTPASLISRADAAMFVEKAAAPARS